MIDLVEKGYSREKARDAIYLAILKLETQMKNRTLSVHDLETPQPMTTIINKLVSRGQTIEGAKELIYRLIDEEKIFVNQDGLISL